MRGSLRNTLFAIIALFLLSCGAKKAPERITVIAPQTFTGTIKIIACDPHAPADNIVIDGSGEGRTSLCAASPDLKLLVTRGKQSTEVAARIAKTGDDFLVRISAEV